MAWLRAAPLAGIVYGSHEALLPVLASELFTVERFAILYTLLQQSTLLGGYGLGTRLVITHLQPPHLGLVQLF